MFYVLFRNIIVYSIKKKKKTKFLTSVKVSMRFVGSQEHGLTWFQDHIIQEVYGEAANVSRVLGVEAQQEVPVAA